MKNNTHKKISIPMKNNTHKKISIPMKNNSQTFQQNFHTHKKWAYPILSAYQTHNQSKIVQQCPKIISNTKLNQWPTLSELRNTKELNNSKMPQNKKSRWPHKDFHPNHTISKNSHKSKQQHMTTPHHKILNKTWNQQIYQQKTKNELTLKSFLDECGAWLLGSWRSPSSSFHSRDGWYFFPLNVRK